MSLTCHRGDNESALDLMRHNPGIAQAGLYEAVHQGHHDIVRLLLDRGADPTRPWRWACWYTPLMHSLRYPEPRYATAQLLLDRGVLPDETNGLGMTALHILAREGTVAAAAWLLERGASLEPRDGQYNSTPLAWAARAGREDMVRFLLSRGARLELPDDALWSKPASWAQKRGLANIVALLS
jgi:ankyrin repeat protein